MQPPSPRREGSGKAELSGEPKPVRDRESKGGPLSAARKSVFLQVLRRNRVGQVLRRDRVVRPLLVPGDGGDPPAVPVVDELDAVDSPHEGLLVGGRAAR